MKVYKGTDKNLQCRGFQYEIGKEYVEDKADLCNAGFHGCERPLDVFAYYYPASSRYFEAELDDVSDQRESDSKVCGKRIKIGAEIGINGIIQAALKFIIEKSDVSAEIRATTGDWAHAATTGNDAHAATTGNDAHAATTGDWSHAATTGYGAHAEVKGRDAIAAALGIGARVKGALGCWLVCAEWAQDEEHNWHLAGVHSAKVDGVNIKADTWYTMKDGKFTEIEED